MSFRLLIVGLGNRARVWGQIIAEEPDLEIAGIVDIDPARVVAFQARVGALPAFDDVATAIAATAPDAVVLVTPPQGHRVQAGTALAAGIPLLSEKPLTLDLAEAVAIVAESEARQVPLTVGLNFRYLSVSRAMRDLVASEQFGAPGFGTFRYLRNRDWWRLGMNKYPLSMEHPMMLEQSVHHLDLIRFCYSREVVAVSCRTWNPPWSVYAHAANVSCLLSLEGGLEIDYVGTWTGGWNELNFQWRTDCPDGVIIQRELFSDLATARTEDRELTPVALDECEPFVDDTRALLRDFVSAIRAGSPAPCSGRDHLRTLAVCFAAIEAAATGRRVEMAEFNARHGVPAG